MFNVYDSFLAGIGFDIAGAYLVSRGLLQRIPQLATLGGTMLALERPRATYAVEDRIRGSVGLVALVAGFVLQAVGYSVYLAERTRLSYGAKGGTSMLSKKGAFVAGVRKVAFRCSPDPEQTGRAAMAARPSRCCASPAWIVANASALVLAGSCFDLDCRDVLFPVDAAFRACGKSERACGDIAFAVFGWVA